MTVQKNKLLEAFEDTGLTMSMTAEVYELVDICSQYNLSTIFEILQKFLNINQI